MFVTGRITLSDGYTKQLANFALRAGICLIIETSFCACSSSQADRVPAVRPPQRFAASTRGRLIVVLKAEDSARVNLATTRRFSDAREAIGTPLAAILATVPGATLHPMFPSHVQRFHASLEKATTSPVASGAGSTTDTNGTRFFVVDSAGDLDVIANRLRMLPGVEAAYVSPLGGPPVHFHVVRGLQSTTKPTTADLTSRQGYLQPAINGGLDALYAWTMPGGDGRGVHLIDLEWAWLLTHEDLQSQQISILGGVPDIDVRHGTAVAGIMVAAKNGIGVTGICPSATLNCYSLQTDLRPTNDQATDDASSVEAAADRLQLGDILILEIHKPGPRYNFKDHAVDSDGNSDQLGYIAVEWWPEYFEAISYATRRGIIVVEAAGNGAENLDEPIYDTGSKLFGSSWKNPFRPGNPQCGAILVGAGAPPAGTHGREPNRPDRSRLSFSNFGSRIDCQSWGDEVTTTGGYGTSEDIQAGPSELVWYSDTFGGTSSATPTVAGAIACLQGIVKARGESPLKPLEVTLLLRMLGQPQQPSADSPVTERIGNRPDLRSMIAYIAKRHSAEK
jgi:subtilisin family serine protease